MLSNSVRSFKFLVVLLAILIVLLICDHRLQDKFFIPLEEFKKPIANLSHRLSGKSLSVLVSKAPKGNPIKGQLVVFDNGETIFWFNGEYWLPLRDDGKRYKPITSYGAYMVKIRFNNNIASSSEVREPLLTTGMTGAGDILYVEYLSKNKIIIGFDHWGSGGARSEPITIDPNKVYNLEISLGSFYPNAPLDLNNNLLKLLKVKLDNKIILKSIANFHETTDEEILVGENRIGGTYSVPKFLGEIVEVRKPY